MLSAHELIEKQAVTLYCHDTEGRLTTTNEPDGSLAPRLFVGRTTEGNLWRFRHDLPPALVRELAQLLVAEPVATDLQQPLHCVPHLRAALAAHAPVTNIWEGPAWWCPEAVAAPGGVAVVPVADAAPLQRTFPRLAAQLAHRQPCVGVLRNGEAVAVCCCARVSEGAAEAGLETQEAHRGRGYATAAAAAWAAAVRETGRIPLYSTSWDNLASQAVARKLGLVRYGTDLSFS